MEVFQKYYVERAYVLELLGDSRIERAYVEFKETTNSFYLLSQFDDFRHTPGFLFGADDIVYNSLRTLYYVTMQPARCK